MFGDVLDEGRKEGMGGRTNEQMIERIKYTNKHMGG